MTKHKIHFQNKWIKDTQLMVINKLAKKANMKMDPRISGYAIKTTDNLLFYVMTQFMKFYKYEKDETPFDAIQKMYENHRMFSIIIPTSLQIEEFEWDGKMFRRQIKNAQGNSGQKLRKQDYEILSKLIFLMVVNMAKYYFGYLAMGVKKSQRIDQKITKGFISYCFDSHLLLGLNKLIVAPKPRRKK